jgi:hypothetical protein
MGRRRKRPSPAGLLDFEAAMREAGHAVQLIWVETGPANTGIAEHATYTLRRSSIYVQAFGAGGWRSFVSGPPMDADAAVRCIIAHTGGLVDAT